jgi:hypothetical protein
MVNRDQIKGVLLREGKPFGTALGNGHDEAMSRQGTRREPAQARVVIDVEDRRSGARFGGCDHPWPSASGTWITDRNRPSWRIAWAKLS